MGLSFEPTIFMLNGQTGKFRPIESRFLFPCRLSSVVCIRHCLYVLEAFPHKVSFGKTKRRMNEWDGKRNRVWRDGDRSKKTEHYCNASCGLWLTHNNNNKMRWVQPIFTITSINDFQWISRIRMSSIYTHTLDIQQWGKKQELNKYIVVEFNEQ